MTVQQPVIPQLPQSALNIIEANPVPSAIIAGGLALAVLGSGAVRVIGILGAGGVAALWIYCATAKGGCGL